MKKLFLLLAAVGMIFTACETGGVDDGGNGTPASSNKIATIEEQGANITATIAALQTTKSAVEATITSLKASEEPATRGNDNGNNGVKTMIAALEERVAGLEQMIANLTGYTQGDLAEMQGWAEATFATMEQYNALASELATLKALLEGFEGVSTAELSEALAASEQSMKQWVNEQLSGYATIADVEAQIAVLTASLTEELKAEVEKVVATLTALMNDTKQEYEKAITEAIQNQGVINDKIAKDIADINKRIDEELATINKRLDDIEKRLDEIEETVKDLVNRIQSVSYLGSSEKSALVVTSAESAIVELSFKISPKSTVSDLSSCWKRYMKVSVNYTGTTQFVDMPIKSFEADSDNGIINITASGENLSDAFYSDLQDASLFLEIYDGNNDRIEGPISIKPKRWFREYIDLIPENNEVYYTTTDSEQLVSNKETLTAYIPFFESDWYDWKKGLFVIKSREDINEIAIQSERLENVVIPNSIKYLGEYAFYGCTSLESINIPYRVTSIGADAFKDCTSLKNIYVTDIKAWYKLNFGNEYADPLWNGGILYLNGKATCGADNEIWYTNGSTTETFSLSAEEFIDSFGAELVSHTYDTEKGCWVLKFNNQVTKFGSAFRETSLISVSIPRSVTEIGAGAFCGCTSLTSVIIPDSVTSIGNVVFYGCTSLAAFYGKFASEDSRCLIVDGVLSSFAPAVLTKYTIPDSVTSIGNQVFRDCASLTSITIPNSVTSIDHMAFARCTSLTSITIPDSVIEIRHYAFSDCTSLTSAEIGNSVISIGNYAFYGCTSLTSVTIPDSVTEIGYGVFNYCTSLKEVYCKAITPPQGGNRMFSYYYSGHYEPIGCKIYVPRNSVEAYKSAEGWKEYADNIVGYDF